jgi:hypothetical protein
MGRDAPPLAPAHNPFYDRDDDRSVAEADPDPDVDFDRGRDRGLD